MAASGGSGAYGGQANACPTLHSIGPLTTEDQPKQFLMGGKKTTAKSTDCDLDK